MRYVPLFVALLAALLATGAGNAGHCTTYTTSQPDVDTGPTPFGQYYVDNDLCQPECWFSIWTYQESNGIPGLQRNDEVVDDTCHGAIESDVSANY